MQEPQPTKLRLSRFRLHAPGAHLADPLFATVKVVIQQPSVNIVTDSHVFIVSGWLHPPSSGTNGIASLTTGLKV
jgi:hypothetical protein